MPVNRPENVLLTILPVLALRWWLRPPVLPRIRPRWAVALGVGAYALIFSFIAVTRHYALRTHALDLGYYLQIVWSISQGGGASTSLPEMHAWGDHFSPILYLLAPFLVLFPDAVLLLIVQSVLFALGAIATFAIARRQLNDERLAAAFAGLYLLNPSLHGVNLRDFHPAGLAIPFLLAAVAGVQTGRPAWVLSAVLLALSTREDAALPVIGLGLWMALARRRWGWGIGLTALGFGWLFLTTGWLMPSFRGGPYPHLHRFTHLGGSVSEILLNLLTHPFGRLASMVSGGRLIYLLALLAPLGFLPLLAPLDLLPALPTLLANLQSRDPVLFHHRSQYTAFVLPFLVLAAISGYRRLLTLAGTGMRGSRLTPRATLALAVLLSLALTARTVNDLAVDRWRLTERHRAAYSLMGTILPNAAVSTGERVVPHLALRPKVFIFPEGLEQSEYVLVDTVGYPWRNLPETTLSREGNAVTITVKGREYRYTVVADPAQYLLLRKAAR